MMNFPVLMIRKISDHRNNEFTFAKLKLFPFPMMGSSIVLPPNECGYERSTLIHPTCWAMSAGQVPCPIAWFPPLKPGMTKNPQQLIAWCAQNGWTPIEHESQILDYSLPVNQDQ